MIKEIIHDPILLSKKSVPVTPEDREDIQNLKDTLCANLDRCVGMALNMTGVPKCAIIASIAGKPVVFLNPEIVSGSDAYEVTERCLSVSGEKKTKRFRKIKLKFQDEDFRWKERTFSGFEAQIIQHECDHLKGILI